MTKEEIEELENDSETGSTKTTVPDVDVDDIDAMLSDYKQRYKETESTPIETVTNNQQPATPTDPTTATANPNAWIGDKRYFQRGAKMGQLKPAFKHHEPAPEKMEISGSLIDAGLFLMLIDMIFPLIITVMNNKFNDTKIKVEDLQLSDKQKRDLEPIAEQVIKQLSVSADPKWLLLGSLAGIYGINYMAVISGADEKPKKKKVETNE